MIDIKKSSKDKTIHTNSMRKVNASFAKFVLDFLAMLMLFDAFIYHNAQAAPAPAGIYQSMSNNCPNKNQIVLIKFCLHQNEDQAWKLFGKREFGNVGWNVSNLDLLWGSSVDIFVSSKLVFLPLTRIIRQPTRERSARR
jgi:hypothetical protein